MHPLGLTLALAVAILATKLYTSSIDALQTVPPGMTAAVYTQAGASVPAGRDFASLVYDGGTGTLVLFGGYDPRGRHSLADTWTWDGAAWAQQTPSVSPPGRANATMAYDALRGTIVLFSGRTETPGSPNPLDSLNLDDTWTWNGSTWTLQSPSRRPPAQADAAMTWDATHGVVLLFGTDGATWTWDGQDWTQQQPGLSPPARARASLAFDVTTSVPVLFGGLNSTGYLNDTWTWDGTNWTQQLPALSPPGRDFAGLTFDANTGTILLFGGFRVDPTPFPHPVDFADTWSWDGFTWRQLTPPASPPPLAGAVMTYDEATGTVVLFGRRSNLAADAANDLWTWDGATWTRRSP